MHREKFISDFYQGIRNNLELNPPPEEDDSPLDFQALLKDAPRIPENGTFHPLPTQPSAHPSTGPNPPPSSADSLFPEDFLEGLPIPDRLASCVEFWKNTLHAPPDVLDHIVNGWPIPWKSDVRPSNIRGSNPRFTREEQLFMWEFALTLAAKGIVKMVDFIPETLLSVFCAEKTDNEPGKDKAYRFLANGRPLKQFMEVPHFRLEDLASLISQLKPGVMYHCFKVDFKDAYFCCPIPEKDQTHFGFCLLDPDNVKHYFVFRAICQGTSQSSFVFDRLLKPVLRHWRRNSTGGSVIYVDDGLGASPSNGLAKTSRDVIIETSIKAGFIVNWKKCVLDPSPTLTGLGFTVDFSVSPATIAPSAKRIASVISKIEGALASSPCIATPRELCSIGGKVGSMRYALGSAQKPAFISGTCSWPCLPAYAVASIGTFPSPSRSKSWRNSRTGCASLQALPPATQGPFGNLTSLSPPHKFLWMLRM